MAGILQDFIKPANLPLPDSSSELVRNGMPPGEQGGEDLDRKMRRGREVLADIPPGDPWGRLYRVGRAFDRGAVTA